MSASKIKDTNIKKREKIWEEILATNLSINFWQDVRTLCTGIKGNNKEKWLQYRIIRHCLMVNSTVNKFVPNVSPLCAYCKSETETILHLFWSCNKAQIFWQQFKTLLERAQVNFFLSRLNIIFGMRNQSSKSAANIAILAAKLFIYQNKFFVLHRDQQSNINFLNFKRKLCVTLKDEIAVDEFCHRNSEPGVENILNLISE